VRRWLDSFLFARSLRGFLLVWLLGGMVVATISIFAIEAWRVGNQLASEQDERLAGALGTLVQAIAQQGGPSLPAPALALPLDTGGSVRIVFRVSAVNGEWLAGERGLAPCPWVQSLPDAGRAGFYVGHLRGQLMRVSAARRHAPAADGVSQDIVIQAAAPWSERIPGAARLREGGLSQALVLACALAGWVSLGIAIVLYWIDRTRQTLSDPMHQSVDAAVPLELRPVLSRVQALLQEKQHWVDQQRRFLADASHQLRTPMAVLRTQLQSAMAGDVRAADVLPQMLHTVDRATGLANQLLSLTKLELLAQRSELQVIDVRAVARDAVLELSPLIAAKRIEFSLDEAELAAPADATMLGELVRNLLANAIHHAPDDGRVGIVLRSGAGRAELIVWDEGPGIADTQRPRLFHPFAASQGGAGLGLSICRQIAEAMGAQVELFNRVDRGGVVGVDAVVAWGQAP